MESADHFSPPWPRGVSQASFPNRSRAVPAAKQAGRKNAQLGGKTQHKCPHCPATLLPPSCLGLPPGGMAVPSTGKTVWAVVFSAAPAVRTCWHYVSTRNRALQKAPAANKNRADLHPALETPRDKKIRVGEGCALHRWEREMFKAHMLHHVGCESPRDGSGMSEDDKTPTVGLEPTTTRLRALRSAD